MLRKLDLLLEQVFQQPTFAGSGKSLGCCIGLGRGGGIVQELRFFPELGNVTRIVSSIEIGEAQIPVWRKEIRFGGFELGQHLDSFCMPSSRFKQLTFVGQNRGRMRIQFAGCFDFSECFLVPTHRLQ